MSDASRVYANWIRYKGNDKADIYESAAKNKKFAVVTPAGKIVNFGMKGSEDFTQHRDTERQKNYLARANGIKGDWKNNKYSPNNLSINVLWQ